MSKKITYLIFLFSITIIITSIWVIKKFPIEDKEKAYLVERETKNNIKGEFELYNVEGELVTEKNFAGKYMLVYFGFTFCPDICPMTIELIKNLMKNLPENVSAQIIPIFVTIDPARDDQIALKKYMKELKSDIVALTGTEEQIGKIKANYRVYSQKIENPENPENYLMDHSSLIYLMDKNSKYLAHYSFNSKLSDIENSLINRIKSDKKRSNE